MSDPVNPAPGAGEGEKPPKTEETKPAPTAAAKPPASGGEEKPKGSVIELRELGDDEDPEEKELYRLSGKALQGRLGRYNKKQLKDHFGTSNVDEIKAQLAEHKELKAKQEEARREKLDSEAKLKEDVEKERKRAETAETRAREVEDAHVVDKQQTRIEKSATAHIDEDLVDDAVERFRKHILSLSPKQVKKFTSEDVGAWFEKLAKDKPKFAKGGAPVADPEADKKKQPITNGGGGARRPPPISADGQKKTARPGQPNSMTKAELKAAGHDF